MPIQQIFLMGSFMVRVLWIRAHPFNYFLLIAVFFCFYLDFGTLTLVWLFGRRIGRAIKTGISGVVTMRTAFALYCFTLCFLFGR